MPTDSMLRPGELKEILLKEIEAADLGSMDVNDVGTVLEVKDGVALIYGLRTAIAGEMLEFTVRETGEYIEIGASVTVTDLLESELMHSIFPRLYQHLKLVSSTPIRNMATLAGNFVNASPIGDMTIWFLALNAEVTFNTGRQMLLRQLYLGYKKLAKEPDEYITSIRITKPQSDFRFNFEKVSKRTYLDIATVNTAASFKVEPIPGKAWVPPALNENYPNPIDPSPLDHYVTDAHIAAGGVAPIPLYLKETSSFLIGRHIDDETFKKASDIMQAEISPISDVRGSEEYKRLLLRQLFRAHFVELFTSQ
jgi:xanthine dehydrogenase small subunit